MLKPAENKSNELLVDEATARNLQIKDFLVVGIPKTEVKKTEKGLDFTAILPNPKERAYSDTREGRQLLEQVENSYLHNIMKMKPGERKNFDNHKIRGMAGGIYLTANDSFIVQSKFYPKSGDRYFSGFSGLSGSVEEARNPEKIIFREGLEEMLIYDSKSRMILFPEIKQLSDLFTESELTAMVEDAIKKCPKDTQDSHTSYRTIGCDIKGDRDVVSVKDHDGNVISKTNCILDINPASNSFDVLKLVDLKELPKDAHFYQTEFGNDVAVIPYEQLQSMWKNWGKSRIFLVHKANGQKITAEYPALFDSLMQQVAMSMGIISGNVRLDYKGYSEKSK